jgi:prepilin-type N-terminal cleavage/methylation domain-containing protein
MRQGEAGFTLIEVLVAFAIVALVLAGIYQALAGAYRGETRAQVQERVLALARAHLEAIGIEQPLEPGETTGTYHTGLAWHLTVAPVAPLSDKGQAFHIVLETQGADGRPLLRLETFKLATGTN